MFESYFQQLSLHTDFILNTAIWLGQRRFNVPSLFCCWLPLPHLFLSLSVPLCTVLIQNFSICSHENNPNIILSLPLCVSSIPFACCFSSLFSLILLVPSVFFSALFYCCSTHSSSTAVTPCSPAALTQTDTQHMLS